MVKKPPDKNKSIEKPLMVSVKNNLHKIIINEYYLDKNFMLILLDTIERTNKIVFHTYNFIKLFYLYLYEINNESERRIEFPKLDIQFIRNVMNVITYKSENRGRKTTDNKDTDKIKNFYDKYYKPLLEPEDFICRDKLKRILNYEEIDIRRRRISIIFSKK